MPDPADSTRPTPPSDDAEPLLGDVAIEQPEAEEPRRTASAEFRVDAEVGSAAAMREAMDPANQSLGEALRLSYRVLQLVIVVLLFLFLVSGCQIVKEGQSGVMTFFGKIRSVDDNEALQPGRHWSYWPYPAGEFEVFNVDNRSVDLGNSFWPHIPSNRTIEEAVDVALVNDPLHPREDGSVLTRDGDLVHLRLTAKYLIDDPVAFAQRVENDNSDPGRLDGDKLVELALQRAVVHVSSVLSLPELVDRSQESKGRIQEAAQEILDSIGCGIRLVEVNLPDSSPPLAIVRAYGELQQAKVAMAEQVEKARQDATGTLIGTAGSGYRRLGRLIDQYTRAEELDRRADADQLLTRIHAFLESDEKAGKVAEIIDRARAYRSEIESTLGQEARRFASLLPEYRKNPQLTRQRLWSETYKAVLDQKGVEVFSVDADGGPVWLKIEGSGEIRQIRRQQWVEEKKRESQQSGWEGPIPSIQRARNINTDRPGRRLEYAPGGGVRGIRERR
ncbi:MAG: SPFH domain-containing protein [Planctomycetota bacterium]|jgi:membrane protease subunit HflK